MNKNIINIFFSLGILIIGSKGAFHLEDAYCLSETVLVKLTEKDTHAFFSNTDPNWWVQFLHDMWGINKGYSPEVKFHRGYSGLLSEGIHRIDPNTLDPGLKEGYLKYSNTYNHFYDLNKTNLCSGLGKTTTLILGVGVIIYVARIVMNSS